MTLPVPENSAAPSSTVAGAQPQRIRNIAREIIDCLEDENLKLNKQEWVNLVALMIAGKTGETEASADNVEATRQN